MNSSRRKPAVETDHQNLVSMVYLVFFVYFVVSRNYFFKLGFGDAEGFFDEDVFTRFKGIDHLTGVLVVAGNDEDRIGLVIIKYLVFI